MCPSIARIGGVMHRSRWALAHAVLHSGQTMREVGQTLMKAGAKAVYPFTITRTVHSDDQ
jgi:predicted amidophosphoribosyltransferase